MKRFIRGVEFAGLLILSFTFGRVWQYFCDAQTMHMEATKRPVIAFHEGDLDPKGLDQLLANVGEE